MDSKSLVWFERDSNTLVVGPTSSGKSSLLRDIVLNGEFDEPPLGIVVFAPIETAKSSWTSETKKKLEDIYSNVQYIFGKGDIISALINAESIPESSIVIFDDFMGYLGDSQMRTLLDHFATVVTHHRHLWTFWVTHNLFVNNLLTIRRNTQNFILFNAIQSDVNAATQFVGRLVGLTMKDVFLGIWSEIVSKDPHGWLRFDQRMRKDPRTILSTSGITTDTVQFILQSFSEEGPFTFALRDPKLQSLGPEINIPTSKNEFDDAEGAPTESQRGETE